MPVPGAKERPSSGVVAARNGGGGKWSGDLSVSACGGVGARESGGGGRRSTDAGGNCNWLGAGARSAGGGGDTDVGEGTGCGNNNFRTTDFGAALAIGGGGDEVTTGGADERAATLVALDGDRFGPASWNSVSKLVIMAITSAAVNNW